MYRIWYWATVDRESDGRCIASIPDLGDLAAYGDTDKDAVAYVTDLAGERVRAVVDGGQPVPPRRHSSEMPNQIRRSKEVGRAIIPVEVERRAAWPTPPITCLLERAKRIIAGNGLGLSGRRQHPVDRGPPHHWAASAENRSSGASDPSSRS